MRMTTRQIKRLQGSCCICLPELAETLLMESDVPYCCLEKLAPRKKLAWLEQLFWSAADSKLSQNSLGRSRL